MSAGDERNERNRGTTLPFGMILIFGFLPGGGRPKGRETRFRPERAVPAGRRGCLNEAVGRSRSPANGHDRMVVTGMAAGVRDLVADSWLRSMAAGINVDASEPPITLDQGLL